MNAIISWNVFLNTIASSKNKNVRAGRKVCPINFSKVFGVVGGFFQKAPYSFSYSVFSKHTRFTPLMPLKMQGIIPFSA